jgi:hypothetical protein
MPEIVYTQPEGEPVHVNLKDQYWGAFLAWLFPGAGHIYQGRYAKGLLFMVCIMSTFLYGLGLGRGRCVYATDSMGKLNYYYIGQVGVGLPALPAVVQSIKTSGGNDPFFELCERFPADYGNVSMRYRKVDREKDGDISRKLTLKDGLMAPPAGPISLNDADTLGMWHFDYKHMFEIGVLYTLVAGLLNMLAIYDAFCGPAIVTMAQKEELAKRKKKGKGDL